MVEIDDELASAIRELKVIEIIDHEGRKRTGEPHAIYRKAGQRGLHCF